MIAPHQFALLANGISLPWAEVPEWRVIDFVQVAAGELDRGGRLCSWFGVREGAESRLVAVVAFDAGNTLAVGRSGPFSGSYPALTRQHVQAHLFEREVWEQHGVIPEDHPWLKPVRGDPGARPGSIDFFRVDGGEIHEVAVGPVHAGIIEPGHFRFQCAGEEVLHLEIALGYQHRGIEETLLGGPHRPTIHQLETVAGDTTVAHATAYATVMEALARVEAPLGAQWLRAVALELERLANHTGDLGALAGDVAFLPTASACGKLRGDFLNLTALICGNRFGRGLVRPGGCRLEVEPGRRKLLREGLDPVLDDVERAAAWLWDAAAVRARFEGTGKVQNSQAAEVGLVGPAARACGLVRDVRFDHPTGWHRFAQIPISVWPDGDVFARARVRWLEIQRSGEFLREQLDIPPDGGMHLELPPPAGDTLAVALVEGWRGEVCHVAITDAIGLYGDTVRPACEFLKKEATSHGVTPSIPEELPRSLYQDSTGEAGNICKIAEYLELARGGIEYREKFSAIGTTSAPGTQSTPGSSTSYKGQFKSPKPSQSGGGFSGGSGGGSGSDSSGKGSSGVGTSAKDILTAPIQAMNILPHQKPVVENRRQKNIDESSSDTEFLATLQQLVIDDPVISDASDKAITNAANSVRSAAPEIAGNPAEFRWVLREILQYDSEDGNVPAHIIKDLQERTSNSLKNRKSQREEAADRYGAKA